ncbi:hypothetical protein SAMN04488057_11568 [Cyclobacterium lianum]|uniref:Beta-lactamase-inhibitor-like, PepSY-like n=1 Tax=Cyclobacterium lianum TaxID=388280 RepID=A0A1M7Q954_9BACT|nr:hypothetical protein [Cyclobacterium lianum]SHN27071.1 hypothetical protein SAMN04488057_11568 [Cyclobacterium lianum]
MRRKLTAKARVGGISLLVIFGLLVYYGTRVEKIGSEYDNHFFQSNVSAGIEIDTVSIMATELPSNVKQVIQTDSLFNDLKITAVKKISRKDNEYYDVSFLDTDDFSIMVMYDKNGGVIRQ